MMKSRLMAGMAGLAAMACLVTVLTLSTHASAQQGPPPAGPQGGALTPRAQNRPGQLLPNLTATVTIDDAAKSAIAKQPGFVSAATLRNGPNGNPIWIVHVVTKPAADGNPGTAVNVIVDSTSGEARVLQQGAGRGGNAPPPAKNGAGL